MSLTSIIEKTSKGMLSGVYELIDEVLEVGEREIEKNSPVDTGQFIRGNRVKNAELSGGKIIGVLYNNSEDAVEVESGFPGKGALNRGKKTGAGRVLIRDNKTVGAQTYKETIRELKATIDHRALDIIYKKIGQ